MTEVLLGICLFLAGCLNLLDLLPETVYRVCDLLIVVMSRNGAQWKEETLGALCKEVRQTVAIFPAGVGADFENRK